MTTKVVVSSFHSPFSFLSIRNYQLVEIEKHDYNIENDVNTIECSVYSNTSK
jgi:hypothetical protein